MCVQFIREGTQDQACSLCFELLRIALFAMFETSVIVGVQYSSECSKSLGHIIRYPCLVKFLIYIRLNLLFKTLLAKGFCVFSDKVGIKLILN